MSKIVCDNAERYGVVPLLNSVPKLSLFPVFVFVFFAKMDKSWKDIDPRKGKRRSLASNNF